VTKPVNREKGDKKCLLHGIVRAINTYGAPAHAAEHVVIAIQKDT
jgi:hypothetical protein